MKKLIVGSLAAGGCIAIGGVVYLATGSAWTFPIGLLMVCYFGFSLFTGKVPYATTDDVSALIVMWFFNMVAAFGVGVLFHFMRPDLAETAKTMVVAKIAAGLWVVPKAALCNVMIFTAVEFWKHDSDVIRIVGLIFCTAVFVMCGFEHCVANAFYFGCALSFGGCVTFLLMNTVWNAVGGLAAKWVVDVTR